jgi:phasin family protein
MAKKIEDTLAITHEPAVSEIKSAASNGFEKTSAAAKNGLATAAAGFEKTQAEVKANMEKAMKTAEEMLSFGKGNVEAVVKSSQILAAGYQDLGKSFAATAQAQFDQTMSTWKAMTGVKSLKDAFDLQTSLVRTSFETAVAETGKLTDASIKLSEQALAPITARVTLAVEKFSRTA